MRSAAADGDSYARLTSISSCTRCGNDQRGTRGTKCANCSKYFCTKCSPTGCPNDSSHEHYEWKPINP